MTPRSRTATLLWALMVVAQLAGCRFDSLRFYDVIRTPLDECDIRPDGEFCVEPEQLSPPVLELWSVERRGDEVLVFTEVDAWTADPPAADADPDQITVTSVVVSSRDPGPCTQTLTRDVLLTADLDQLKGELETSSRLTGPEACGETPTGLRTRARLEGTAAGAP